MVSKFNMILALIRVCLVQVFDFGEGVCQLEVFVLRFLLPNDLTHLVPKLSAPLIHVKLRTLLVFADARVRLSFALLSDGAHGVLLSLLHAIGFTVALYGVDKSILLRLQLLYLLGQLKVSHVLRHVVKIDGSHVLSQNW